MQHIFDMLPSRSIDPPDHKHVNPGSGKKKIPYGPQADKETGIFFRKIKPDQKNAKPPLTKWDDEVDAKGGEGGAGSLLWKNLSLSATSGGEGQGGSKGQRCFEVGQGSGK